MAPASPRIIPVRSFEKGRQVSGETTRIASHALRNPMLKTASLPPVMAISATPLRTIQNAWPMAWLEEEHERADGIWLKIAKKASGIESVTHAEALEIALCFGWIDGQRKTFDENWFLQRFTPRRRGSKWSRINREKVEALIAADRIRPAGRGGRDCARFG